MPLATEVIPRRYRLAFLFAGFLLMCEPIRVWGQASDLSLWAFRPPQRPAVPQSPSDGWSISEIDRFIYQRLVSAGMQPSADAAAATLIRRLYYDLIGLPPTPDDCERVEKRLVSETLEVVLSDEVDRLLNTLAFGERWGRHWMDVARFAESSGKEANISFPYAWRYRDYVIDSFNRDLPFDRFLVEQLAGDLLSYETPAERARLLIATGFLAIGPKNLDEANEKQFDADLIDEQIDTVSRAVMAHSIACARCHDHKSDPYTMEDYYGLAGIFASTKTYFGTFVSPANRMGGDPLPLPRSAHQPVLQPSISEARVKELKEELASLKKEHEEGMAAIMEAKLAGRDASNLFTLRDALRIFWSSGGIEGQLEQVDDQGNALPLSMGVLQRDAVVDVPLLERGDIAQPTETIARRLPQPILVDQRFPIEDGECGRLQLAQWLTHPSHPLTSRVIVNRVWHHLMGKGLVSTVDDFGSTGEAPSHPELLDHLAVQLIDDGWSIKRLIRRLVLSRVYRQSSTFQPKYFEWDPDNRLWWRASKRRMDAEAIRDAMLVASGELDRRRPVGSLVAKVIGDRPISLIGLDQRIPIDLDGAVHRSVYLPMIRDRLPDVLAIFDAAEPSLVTGARETTNVPVQALYLMNSPFVDARAKGLAARVTDEVDRIHRDAPPSPTIRDRLRIQSVYRHCLARLPDARELDWGLRFVAEGRARDGEERGDMRAMACYCQAILASAEFRNLD